MKMPMLVPYRWMRLTPTEERLRREQVDAIFRAVIPGVTAAALAAVVLGVFLVRLGEAGPTVAGGWATAIAVCAICHVTLALAYRRSPPATRAEKVWPLVFTLFALAEGVAWGLASVVLTPDAAFDVRFLAVAVTIGVTAGAIPAFSPYLPAYFALFLPATLPYALTSLREDTAVEQASSALMLIFVVAMVLLGILSNRAFSETIRLRLQTEALAADLRRQKEIAEAASRAKSSFLAAASHDLRQPVHALGLFAGALRRIDLPEEAYVLVDRIEDSAAAMDGLFTAILDISRLDAGVVEVRNQAFRIGPYLDRLCKDLAVEAEAKGLRLRCRPCPIVVDTDPILLERVLRNLVSNAVRYTLRGGILVGCRRRADRLAIQIWDTGIGIAPEDMDRIFQEYVQVGNPERDRTKGLGLGLAIVRRICNVLKAPLGLRSCPGRGSCFEVSVPCANEAALTDGTRQDPPGAFIPAFVVVIDDEAPIREAMEQLLAGWGYEVVTASSGIEAIELLASRPTRPDLIISDYRLRDGETGIAAIENLRSEYNVTIPALLVTGDTAPDRLAEAEASNLLLLHKPVPNSRLRAAMLNLIAHAQKSEDDD